MITGGPGNPGDYLTFAQASTPGTQVTAPIYLNGLTAHNTANPIPSPQGGFIPPVTSSSSPLYGNAAALRDWSNFYVEALSSTISGEYQFYPRFFINNAGGVYAYGASAEASQSLEGAYGNYIAHCNFDGARGDNQTDPYSSAQDGFDGTFWLVAEAFGRIVKLDHTGAVTTIAGATTNRSKLGFNGGTPPDPGATEAAIDASGCLTQIGTIGTPGFDNLRGINQLTYDPRDPTGNTVFVANPIRHTITKIVWPGPGLHVGTPTMTRYAGQNKGLGGQTFFQAGFNGGYIDGPATEYVSGASVATFNGTITGNILTVNSGYTVVSGARLVAGCPLSWSGNPNTATGNMVTAHIAGSGNGSTWQVNVASSAGAQNSR